ncbi:E3 ubiquitin protein ligase DRIP2-like isoform X1 [Zingiber officinale]|uniref:E3 ubiquitin protein ligase DRIP2-like isoform X1 n=1 Tax=Zingiber officinale TaxID=94328 RepID=UPI001C4B5399|nr:E3 ubiquitin protein ligase DRIP2-like isoform X1 [Zingiber officinale]
MADVGAAARGPSMVVKVRREVMVACMTCPLCHKLLRDATTIPECLHTFCRKCITEKLNDEETYQCPVCNICLGVIPMEKLRPDHNLQDIKTKIFPPKRSKTETLDETSTPMIPTKRKEKSLSSLVVSTSHIATQTCSTGRRTKAVTKRAVYARGLRPSFNESSEKDDNIIDNYVEKSNSIEKMRKVSLKRKQTHSNVEPSNHMFYEGKQNGGLSFQDKVDIWNPLNCLVEAANRTKAFSSVPQRPVVKDEKFNDYGGETNISNERHKVHQHKSKILEKTDSILMQPVTQKESRLQKVTRSNDLTASARSSHDAQNSQSVRKINPIWFSLVPSVEQLQIGDPQFPQISSNYLRVKDGSMPVLFIHKYLVKKLNLQNEASVQITCLGQPVSPTTAINKLVEQWLSEKSSQRLPAAIGASAKEFVMVLVYSWSKVSDNKL